MCTETQPQKISCISDSFLGLGLRQLNGTRQWDSISRVFPLTVENLVVYSHLASWVPITTATDELGHMWLLCLLLLTWCPSVIWKTSKTGAGDSIVRLKVRTGARSQGHSFLNVELLATFGI